MVTLDLGCSWHQQPNAIHVDIKTYDPYFKISYRVDIIASVEYLPIKTGSIDKVYLFEVLEHCYNPYGVLLEIHRVIKSEGYCFLSIPNPYWIMRFIRFIFGDFADYGAREHIFGWTFAEIKSLVELCNFRINNYIWMSFLYRVKKKKKIKRYISKYFRRLTNYSLLLVLVKDENKIC